MRNFYVYLDYPSGAERQIIIDDWLMQKNFLSVTGEYPFDYWFSPGFVPDADLVEFLNGVCHKAPRDE